MLRLRPFRKSDAKEIITWIRDEEAFYKWSAGRLGTFPLSEQRFLAENAGKEEDDRYFPFTAFDENGLAGFFIMRIPGESDRDLRMGFIIVNPKIRGKGYGKKMLTLAFKYAFEIYGAERVSLGVFENNPAAYHCYQSVGLRESGEAELYPIMGTEWKCIDLEIRR